MPSFIDQIVNSPLTLICVLLVLIPFAPAGVFLLRGPKLFLLIFKNLRRNVLRTTLTCLATMVLVLMVTLIATVVFALDQFMEEKSKDLKLIVTERWQIPSMLPATHADYLDPANPKFILKGMKVGPDDFMTWSFYGGTADQAKMTFENLVFFFVMNPRQIRTMMEDLENLDPRLVQKMIDTPNACLMGREKMETINKKVGERFKLNSMNYKGIDLDFEIVGMLPEGRYNNNAIMNIDYFNKALEKYEREKGKKHPLDQKRLNLIWLRVPDRPTFEKVAEVIETASVFKDRPVRCETLSSGIASFMEPFKDLLWGMKWLLVPAILVSMALVVANTIGISVRERQKEMAVMKVLGYRPRQILTLVLGESLLVGGGGGLLAALLTFGIVNLAGGIRFPILWFPAFPVPWQALLWGPAMGFGTALIGSFLPAWTARSVKVSEVFSKVA